LHDHGYIVSLARQVGLLGAQVMTLRLLEQEGKKVTVVAACEKEADAARGTMSFCIIQACFVVDF
jgi:hypothetical protein